MKSKNLLILSILFLIMSFTGCYKTFNNEYREDKKRIITVLDKLEQAGGYKYPGKFYIIAKDEVTRKVFDFTASPATYSQLKVGQQYHFKFSDQDMDIEPQSPFLTNTLPFILFLGGLVGFAFAMSFFIDKHYNLSR